MSNYAFTMTPTAITVLIDAKTHTVKHGDDRFDKVKEAILMEDFDQIPVILDIKGRLVSESNGGLYLLNGVLRSEKYAIPALLATRIIEMYKGGFNVTPLTLFLDNLMQNPNESGTIVEELYGFLEACNLPITSDGHFLAYKMVRKDFKDIYTGKMDNSVGQVIEMPREQCDFDRGSTCSTGLHFCSEGYLGHYGTESSSQVVVVKVNPRDVTSIPTDYNNAKGRACRYEIVDAIKWDEIIDPLFTDKYAEEPEQEDLFDEDGWEAESEIPFDDNLMCRWELRRTDDNSLIDEFVSRQDARDFRNSLAPYQSEYYIWDKKNNEVVAGYRDFTLDVEDEPEDDEPEQDASSGVKLNESKVRQIRRTLINGLYDSIAELARRFGVSERTIRRIRDWESWTHVNP